MTDRDEAELDWWRKVFACRFHAVNLPKPRTALYGMRFVLMVDEPHEELRPYAQERSAL